MTTIAYDGHTLASDSQVGDDVTKDPYGVKKIWKVGEFIIGCYGRYTSAIRFVDWVKSGMPDDARPSGLGDFGAIVIKSGKRPVFYEDGVTPISLRGPLATGGSGGHYAMAAMLAGATAPEAVKIACRLDPSSGGAVQKLSFDGRRNKKAG